MRYKQYAEKALRSIKEHDSRELALCDWTLGLSGETGEVTQLIQTWAQSSVRIPSDEFKMELAKELGDIIWYIAALSHDLNIPLSEEAFTLREKVCCQSSVTVVTLELATNVGVISEAMKHHIMHKEPVNIESIYSAMNNILTMIQCIAFNFGFNIILVAQLNVEKLAHRYNGGAYNREASANRHSKEAKFTDTDVYKGLRAEILREEQ